MAIGGLIKSNVTPASTMKSFVPSGEPKQVAAPMTPIRVQTIGRKARRVTLSIPP